MRKLTLMCLLAAVVLTACGSDDKKEAAKPASDTKSTTTVGTGSGSTTATKENFIDLVENSKNGSFSVSYGDNELVRSLARDASGNLRADRPPTGDLGLDTMDYRVDGKVVRCTGQSCEGSNLDWENVFIPLSAYWQLTGVDSRDITSESATTIAGREAVCAVISAAGYNGAVGALAPAATGNVTVCADKKTGAPLKVSGAGADYTATKVSDTVAAVTLPEYKKQG